MAKLNERQRALYKALFDLTLGDMAKFGDGFRGNAVSMLFLLHEEMGQTEMIYGMTPAEIEIGKNEGKIACIKAVLARTDMALADSKDTVEKCFSSLGIAFYGCKP